MTTAGDQYTEWLQESQKFNYFLAGLIAAVLSFSLQFFSYSDFERAAWLLVLAWVALLAALLMSLFAIRTRVTLLGLEVHYLRESGILAQLEDVRLKSGLAPIDIIDRATGQPMSDSELVREVARRKSVVDILSEGQTTQGEKTGRLYRWRNWLFGTGLSLLVVARVLNLS